VRRGFLKLMLLAGTWTVPLARAGTRPRFRPVPAGKTVLVKMRHSAFPYAGENPETHEPFINVTDGKRRGHKSPRGGIKWEDESYSDRRTLLDIPQGFDLGKAAALLVYFHGNEATLRRDVIDRQHITAQLAQSRFNAVLAAPQLAYDTRDSSPGNFWQPGYFRKWLEEVDSTLASLHGQEAKASDFDRLPVVIVAYSGGYFPAAWTLKNGGAGKRIAGVVLMDALYGDTEKFAGWIGEHHQRSFFFSAYSKSSRLWNLQLRDALLQMGLKPQMALPDVLGPSTCCFFEVPPGIAHVDFMTAAWTADPLVWLLSRLDVALLQSARRI
jgi:hypothetical protein